MRRPLVRDVKDVVKKTLGCNRRVFLDNRSVVVLLMPKISEVIKIKKAIEKMGNEMDYAERKMGFELLYDPTAYYEGKTFKFYITKKEDKDEDR